ncbi:uncharacterized protein PG998_010162 [Apiospora kogelbergensis]|uniref:uncharacterized protein n=1 Tax=Apiospora kogelbergensis TaxID=1337665 RepID=UPI00312F1A6B
MSRTLETTLLSLVPTYPSASSLPRPLVDLASSLLTQSRHNASTLKAEEEVAREHACAHLACERLKTSLDLPPIQARPPVPPRIYKRLYTHLDHILPAASAAGGRVRTPSSKLREAQGFGGPSSACTTAPRPPRRPRWRSSGRGPIPAARRASCQRKGGAVTPGKRKFEDRDVLPPWIRPTIQFVCTKVNETRVARIMLAGMETIVLPRGRRTTDEWVNANLAPLLAGISFLTVWQIHVLEVEKPDRKVYAKAREQVLDAIMKARDEVVVKGVDDEDEAWEGWSNIKSEDIDRAVEKGTKSGWQESGWFGSIRDMVEACGTGKGNAAGEDLEGGDGDEDDGETVNPMQMQRGDSMFQGRWAMTDRKREDYRRWKDDVLARIEEIKKEQETEMDIDKEAA